ncbi:MAG: hypothetical protein LBS29_04295 [Endomicrobium sp.]|jgi:hypothetical protein|nr:hypothetical protein [Endomicrobium sp.]
MFDELMPYIKSGIMVISAVVGTVLFLILLRFLLRVLPQPLYLLFNRKNLDKTVVCVIVKDIRVYPQVGVYLIVEDEDGYRFIVRERGEETSIAGDVLECILYENTKNGRKDYYLWSKFANTRKYKNIVEA